MRLPAISTARCANFAPTPRGFDRLAVLAAISVTHEFLALRKQHSGADQSVTDGLAALRRKLEAALEPAPPRA